MDDPDDYLSPVRSGGSGKVLKRGQFDVLTRAREATDAARDEADQILDEARAEAERIKTAAVTEGKRESARIVTAHTLAISRDLAAMQPRMVKIVTSAVRRILSEMPEEQFVAEAVRRAIEDLDISRTATLVVPPTLLPRVRAFLERQPLDSDVLNFSGDPFADGDSVILRTVYGDIELDLDSQLDALSEGIEAALTEHTR